MWERLVMHFIEVLTPFLATLIAGGIGAYATWKVAVFNQEWAVMKTFLDARLSAFQDFEVAFYALSISKSLQDTAALYRAGNQISLVAGEETIEKAGLLQNIIRRWETGTAELDLNALTQAHLGLLYAMHEDLLTYPHSSSKSIAKARKKATQKVVK